MLPFHCELRVLSSIEIWQMTIHPFTKSGTNKTTPGGDTGAFSLTVIPDSTYWAKHHRKKTQQKADYGFVCLFVCLEASTFFPAGERGQILFSMLDPSPSCSPFIVTCLVKCSPWVFRVQWLMSLWKLTLFLRFAIENTMRRINILWE